MIRRLKFKQKVAMKKSKSSLILRTLNGTIIIRILLLSMRVQRVCRQHLINGWFLNYFLFFQRRAVTLLLNPWYDCFRPVFQSCDCSIRLRRRLIRNNFTREYENLDLSLTLIALLDHMNKKSLKLSSNYNFISF